jgi:hypothetical protein
VTTLRKKKGVTFIDKRWDDKKQLTDISAHEQLLAILAPPPKAGMSYASVPARCPMTSLRTLGDAIRNGPYSIISSHPKFAAQSLKRTEYFAYCEYSLRNVLNEGKSKEKEKRTSIG